MLNLGKLLAGCALSIVLVSQAEAGPTTITVEHVLDFEGFAHGTVIDDEYANLFGTGSGVTIEARRSNYWTSGYADVFDTRGSSPDRYNGGNSSHGGDKDLWAGFDGTRNNNDYNDSEAGTTLMNPGNVLIVQDNEHYGGCSAGTCTTPDDEVGGYIIFTFDKPVDIESLAFFDLDEGSTSAKMYFWDEDGGTGTHGTEHIEDIAGTGDNTAQLVDFPTDENPVTYNAEGIVRLKVRMVGSGAIDNLKFTTSEVVVPEPASIALFGTSLALLGWARRRRNAAAGATA